MNETKKMIGAHRDPHITPGGFSRPFRRTGDPRTYRERLTVAALKQAAQEALERRGVQHDPAPWRDGCFANAGVRPT